MHPLLNAFMTVPECSSRPYPSAAQGRMGSILTEAGCGPAGDEHCRRCFELVFLFMACMFRMQLLHSPSKPVPFGNNAHISMTTAKSSRFTTLCSSVRIKPCLTLTMPSEQWSSTSASSATARKPTVGCLGSVLWKRLYLGKLKIAQSAAARLTAGGLESKEG
jgi:hypothetical protein